MIFYSLKFQSNVLLLLKNSNLSAIVQSLNSKISCGTFIDYPMTSYNYSFSECIGIRVVRVKDITYEQISDIKIDCSITFEDFYNQQLKEQNINRTYEDNDYVFLVEFA